MQSGIWQRVLKDKYFPHNLVISWLRSVVLVVQFGSQTWKNIINALPLLVHWLAWKPLSGVDIIIGKDVILGLGVGYFLSQELIQHLNDHQVVFLFQARSASAIGSLCSNWLTCDDLGLEGDLVVEWEGYKKRLIDADIALIGTKDELIWTGGDETWILTTRNVYNAPVAEIWEKNKSGCQRQI